MEENFGMRGDVRHGVDGYRYGFDGCHWCGYNP
jgi:hypothetical protein